MPQTISIPMPSQGVNLNRPSTFINKEQTPDALNTRYNRGYIGPRPGLTAYGDDLNEVMLGIGTFYLLDGTQKLVLVTENSIYQYDASAGTWSLLTYTSMSGGSINYPVSFAHAATNSSGTLTAGWYLVISNGVDGVAVWDGSNNPTALLASSNYYAKQVFCYKNCLVLLAAATSGNTDPNIVIWSAVGTIDEFDHTTTNSGFNYLYDTPGIIQWAGQLGDAWAIYKNDSIVLMSYTGGTELFRFDTAVRGGGLLAPGMLAVLENEHIYIGKDNVYRWSGGTPVAIGDAIFSDLKANINWSAIEASRCQIIKEDNLVIFYIPSTGQTYADRAYVYNYVEGWWSIDDYTSNVTAVGLWSGFGGLLWSSLGTETWMDYAAISWADIAPNEAQDVNILANSGGQAYVQDTASLVDGTGVAIDQYHITPDIVPDGAEYEGRYVQYLALEFEAKGSSNAAGDMTVSYSTDEGSTWTSIAAQQLSSAWTFYRLNLSVTTRKIRFKFQTTTTSRNFYVRWIGLRVAPRGRL